VLNLYVASGISRMSMTDLTIAVLPWLGTMVVFLANRHLLAGTVDVAAEGAGDDVGSPPPNFA
jgi:hypothetical protein